MGWAGTGALAGLAVGSVLGCATGETPIPAVDGPLTLELRYPGLAPLGPIDSVALWGSIGTGRGRLRVDGRPVEVAPNGGFAAFVPVPAGARPTLRLEARKGTRVIRRSITLARRPAQPSPQRTPTPIRRWVRLARRPAGDSVDAATQSRPIYARASPGGEIALAIPQGIRALADAQSGNGVRLRLTADLSVWVLATEIEPAEPRRLPLVPLGPRLLLADRADRPTVAIAAPEPVPTEVELTGADLRWTLLGARAAPIKPIRAGQGLVARAAVRSDGKGRVGLTIRLTTRPLGWRVRWTEGRMVLELRPPPRGPSLRGLVVALDPGHPPSGSVGPTGLREDSLTLAVAKEAAILLRRAGARPVLVRDGPEPVSLEARIARAEAAEAGLLVSIHANAPAEGRPPWSVDGTRVFWLSPLAEPLAQRLEDSVAAAMAQVEAGVLREDLAVLRPSWFPSVLVEGTALVTPLREAYLRSPRGIAEYAAGLVRGIQGWVATLKP
jgi:N-acetylmuramoyl-L-alanine amidase